MKTVNTTTTEITTLEQARAEYGGITICEFTKGSGYGCAVEEEEARSGCNNECDECPFYQMQPNECKIERIYSTRHSFLIEVDGVSGTFVVPRGLRPEHLFPSAKLSNKVKEQIMNLDLEEEYASFYVRTWKARGKLRRHNFERTEERFMFVCDKEEANAVLVFTPYWATPRGGSSHVGKSSYDEQIGVLAYNSAENTEHGGIESWLFQYSPKDDCLIIPADPICEDIDLIMDYLKRNGSWPSLPE